MAYQTAPNAAFVIHAGDMVDTAHRDYEWAQWFKAGGFIHSQWTAIPVVGNHEFQRINGLSPKRLSVQWRPQFTLPVEKNLHEKLHETVYTVEYQDVLILVLNSTDFLEKQTTYIEEKLSKSDATFLTKLDAKWCSMAPKHVLEGQDIPNSPYNNPPIASGPFKFVEWKRI